MIPIADLHCDLLFYLENHSGRTAQQTSARCSIPQLRAGHVKLQTLAVFTETGPLSVKKGMNQTKIYKDLVIHYPGDFMHVHSLINGPIQNDQIGLLMAFENASGFCGEQEPLEKGLKRLREVIREIAKPLYVSLTWNKANRFGGGALTQIGLREDGKRLLEELHQQQIAIDLSHTSDALAYDILDYMENKGLKMPVMASHSNSRAITAVPRNLPDEIAQEIFRRKGIIGFNLYRLFIGSHEEDILKHFIHWLEKGGENYISFGSDFFYEGDFPNLYDQGKKEPFFDLYQNASCYQNLIGFIHSQLNLSEDTLKGLAYQNMFNFFNHSCYPI